MSSKRHKRRKSCEHKKRFASYAEALAMAKQRHLVAYGCRFCGGFYIGHQIGSTRRSLACFDRAL